MAVLHLLRLSFLSPPFSSITWCSKTWPIAPSVKHGRLCFGLMREHSHSGWGALALIRTQSYFVFQPLQMSRELMRERKMKETRDGERRLVRTFKKIDIIARVKDLTVDVQQLILHMASSWFYFWFLKTEWQIYGSPGQQNDWVWCMCMDKHGWVPTLTLTDNMQTKTFERAAKPESLICVNVENNTNSHNVQTSCDFADNYRKPVLCHLNMQNDKIMFSIHYVLWHGR